MLLCGGFECKIIKNRITIPSKLWKEIKRARVEFIVLQKRRISWERKIYPYLNLEFLISEKEEITETKIKIDLRDRNKVRIPKNLITFLKLKEKDKIFIIGQKDSLSIWKEETWKDLLERHSKRKEVLIKRKLRKYGVNIEDY